MEIHSIYNLFKILHIIGFTAAIGITIATYLAYNQFWKLYRYNNAMGAAAFRTFRLLQIAGMIGLTLVLVAGICMLALTSWAFMHQIWFHIKLTLVLLIFVTGFTIGRTSTLKLKNFLAKDQSGSGMNDEARQIRSRLRTYHIIQLFLYASIIVLSVFRFT